MIDGLIGSGGRLYADAEPTERHAPVLNISDLWKEPKTANTPDRAPELEAPDSRRFSLKFWRKPGNPLEFWTTSGEIFGISSIAAGFGWFSPGLGMIAGGIGVLVLSMAAGSSG